MSSLLVTGRLQTRESHEVEQRSLRCLVEWLLVRSVPAARRSKRFFFKISFSTQVPAHYHDIKVLRGVPGRINHPIGRYEQPSQSE